MQKSKGIHWDKSFLISCFFGGVVACVIDIIMSLLLAIGISQEYIREQNIIYIGPVALFISTLVGMLIARKSNEFGVFITSAFTGVFSFVMRMCIAMLFFDGVAVQSLLGMVAAIGTSLLAVCLLHKRKGERATRRTKKRRW